MQRRDPAARAAGQHARTIVQRLRLRTLVALGALAVGTTYLGRTLGLHDPIFLTSEITLLLAILVVSHSILPLVERHERGATGEEQVGGLLETLASEGWCVVHDASFGHGNVDHILIGARGRLHGRDEEPSRTDHAPRDSRRDARAGSLGAACDRAHHGRAGGVADRLQPRVGRSAVGAPQGRADRAREDAHLLPRAQAAEARRGGDRSRAQARARIAGRTCAAPQRLISATHSSTSPAPPSPAGPGDVQTGQVNGPDSCRKGALRAL